FGNGRAFEYLITKLAANELPECRALATDMHRELALVIPAFVKRALDERYGLPAAERLGRVREVTARLAPRTGAREPSPAVRLLEYDPEAERKVVAAALFPHSDARLEELPGAPGDAIEAATTAHGHMERDLGPALAQYVVPLAYRLRWYFRVNLREIYHLCELRTTPQGHPDYRWVAQEMFRQVSEVHPRLARYARFVDMGPGDEL